MLPAPRTVVSDDMVACRLKDKYLMAKLRGKELVKEVVVKELITLEDTSVESVPDERSSQEHMFAPTQEEEKEKDKQERGDMKELEGIENAFLPTKLQAKAGIQKKK